MTMITLTQKLIKERFAQCNQAYFEGKLRRPQIIRITRAKGYVAKVTYYPNKKTRRCEGLKLIFSEMYEYDDEMFTNVMVHEMIHVYMLRKWIMEKDPHGPRWQKMADEMNSKYGLNIQESSDLTPKGGFSLMESIFYFCVGLYQWLRHPNNYSLEK